MSTSEGFPTFLQATEALKITGYELQELNVVDEVIKEPIGGAHADPYQASMNVKEVIMKHVKVSGRSAEARLTTWGYAETRESR
jgi:acetyl-CoA carboxylase alpha subunit